jgi:DNA-binding MarR family transcriptional regulator
MDFFDVLVRYETRLWNHLDTKLRNGGGVSLATLTALRVANRYPGSCPVQDLRRALDITVGTGSKLVDRLERDWLVVRRAHPSDRRSSLIELTSVGQTALAAGVELLQDALAEQLGNKPSVALATGALRGLGQQLDLVQVAS